MWDKFIKKRRKSGIQSLVLIIGVLIGFMGISSLSDVTVLQTKFSVLSQQAGYVSRAVAKQGGVRTSQIDNYHGRYITSQELYTNVKRAMNNAGIADDEFRVVVGGHLLTPVTETPVYDYRERIPVSITIEYNWEFLDNFLSSGKRTRKSQTEVVSTHKIRGSGFKEN